MARKNWQRYLAEFIGTFALVFAGCGAIITNVAKDGVVGHVGICLTFGFVILAMIYALGPISAAHFNPAVTFGFCIAKRFPWRYAPAYIASQCAGAMFASLMHRVLYGGAIALQANYGATIPTISTPAAFCLELILTFFLMLVIMAVATDKRANGAIAGLAIGLTVTVCALFAGPLTGASMNPARSLAPALLSGGHALSALALYIIAPVVGAALAAWCYELMRDGSLHAQSAPADLDAAMEQEPGLSRSATAG